jgi:hypothetical protein
MFRLSSVQTRGWRAVWVQGGNGQDRHEITKWAVFPLRSAKLEC